MKRMILAVVVGSGAALFAASPARADEPKPVPTTSSAPVVVSSTPDVVTSAPASRRGLIGRLRDRRTGGTMTTSPLTTTGTIVTPSTTTSPGTTIPTPIPMPMGKPSIVLPAGATTTNSPVVSTAAYAVPVRSGVFTRGRTRTTTAVATTPMPLPLSAVVPASGTVTMASPTMVVMPATTTPTPTRMGLVARLRARGK